MSRVTREVLASRLSTFMKEDKYSGDNVPPLPAGTVMLAGAMKTGTTWMQQILHGLRTAGSLDFENIFDVIPMWEFNRKRFEESAATQKLQPPMCKTHSPVECCPTADKVVFITRDPGDAALSLYHFFVDFLFTNEELSLDEFVKIFVVEHGDVQHPLNAHQLSHLGSWYPHRKDENVLWLHYEDLKADLKQCVRLISDFTGIGVGDQELLDLVEHQASLDFMKQHLSKFSNDKRRLLITTTGPMSQVNTGKLNVGQKVRTGAVNESRTTFSAEALQAIQQKWVELIKPVTGFDSYAEMRASVNEELGRCFSA